MAGSCLLAPAAAASMLPSMAAYVTPAHAVTGMFATSIVGTHMQARCTIDGSYVDKLLHFAAALRIYTPNIFPVRSLPRAPYRLLAFSPLLGCRVRGPQPVR